MKITARQYAEALFETTEGKSGKELEAAIKDFVSLLASRHELARSREIVRLFESAWRRKYKVADIHLTTAHEAPEKLIKMLGQAFPEATVTRQVRPDLIGGAVVQIDDRRFDGSVAGALGRLQEQMYG